MARSASSLNLYANFGENSGLDTGSRLESTATGRELESTQAGSAAATEIAKSTCVSTYGLSARPSSASEAAKTTTDSQLGIKEDLEQQQAVLKQIGGLAAQVEADVQSKYEDTHRFFRMQVCVFSADVGGVGARATYIILVVL
jgi:hypothetical protein